MEAGIFKTLVDLLKPETKKKDSLVDYDLAQLTYIAKELEQIHRWQMEDFKKE